MNFLDSLASYKIKSARAAVAAANPKSDKLPYKHHLYDKILKIREESLNSKKYSNLETHANASGGSCMFAGLTLMFIIIDDLPFECIWRTWLRATTNATQNFVRVIIHAKYPDRVQSPWVKAHLCKSFQLKPEWGSLELTDVMFRLLNEAVHGDGSDCSHSHHGERISYDESHELARHSSHFCFVSESCLPIVSLDTALERIGIIPSQAKPGHQSEAVMDSSGEQAIGLPVQKHVVPEQSWLFYSPKATNGYAQQYQFSVLQGVIPPECLLKSDQWALLSREHALKILELPHRLRNDDLSAEDVDHSDTNDTRSTIYKKNAGEASALLRLFKNVRASDELFLPCSLSILGYITAHASTDSAAEDSQQALVLRRQLTWCDWSEGGKNPRSYGPQDFTTQQLESARAKGCLFFRKVILKTEGDRAGETEEGRRVRFCEEWAARVLGLTSAAQECRGILGEMTQAHLSSGHLESAEGRDTIDKRRSNQSALRSSAMTIEEVRKQAMAITSERVQMTENLSALMNSSQARKRGYEDAEWRPRLSKARSGLGGLENES